MVVVARTWLVVPVLVLGTACAASSGSGSGTPVEKQDDTSHQCDVMRRAIVTDKQKRNEAQAAGDSVEAAKQRHEVELDARAARSIAGCDISDLVGANVGQ